MKSWNERDRGENSTRQPIWRVCRRAECSVQYAKDIGKVVASDSRVETASGRWRNRTRRMRMENTLLKDEDERWPAGRRHGKGKGKINASGKRW